MVAQKTKGLFTKLSIAGLIFGLSNTSLVPLISTQVVSAESNQIAMKDGAILHAWCWSFNTIKQNMKAIKDADYTSIQTSPINAVIPGDNGSKDLKNWYFHYQPTDYTIGNYQLGTEDEFKAMAAEADKYGINIIVDAVLNHTTTDINAVSEKIKAIPDWTHGNQGITNDYDRYQVTQHTLLGLYDLNTQNKAVQEYLLNYLKQAVADGADGFRFDAAKHIELPGEFNSDFWTNILANSGAKFQYGEVLQGAASRESDYGKLMGVTASHYGEFIRKVIGQGYVKDGDLVNYQVPGVSEDNLIPWVESHDNYANDSEESTKLTDQDIILGWSIIGARKEGAPLFFSRPVGGGGQHGRFPGTTKIGDAGSDLFKDPTIVAINKFRNAMNGQSEYTRNPNMDQGLVMIERGGKGAVITNLTSEEKRIHSETTLADGQYKDTITGHIFEVSNKQISGKMAPRTVAVLYPITQ
ncbi:alpha-amylase [Streptococcus dysgalactiae subsp. dysgalactiae]|uniref:alpha-amylase family glycosyl hydrolase n=1 Tax=Streptococcus dysgalactiae TaxID=1334 RepID=UPI000219DFA8|nr:alpha-amylase family glycosyl hydrolase [Streptococcus dysgalactiae]EGR88601.1 alpha amylase, catalytic domain protein [Streptococcus dysgalactiae subsp. equisimilis SK1250]MBM6514593.1 alpha-amylase [Streptococcus dysgalactiae subsp. equisimilis]QFZ09010.1 alpha-amylase [Streptococcus dysgalactiae]QGH00714.1 alpha-amylase [Streptococcus dysgalactiae subsp. dysgalactiae]